MTNEEYDNAIKKINIEIDKIKKEMQIKKEKINIEYASSNNPYNIDDIIEDHAGKIIVKKIGVSFCYFSGYPECYYKGTELRKDGKPKKRQTNRKVFQSNIVTRKN